MEGDPVGSFRTVTLDTANTDSLTVPPWIAEIHEALRTDPLRAFVLALGT